MRGQPKETGELRISGCFSQTDVTEQSLPEGEVRMVLPQSLLQRRQRSLVARYRLAVLLEGEYQPHCAVNMPLSSFLEFARIVLHERALDKPFS